MENTGFFTQNPFFAFILLIQHEKTNYKQIKTQYMSRVFVEQIGISTFSYIHSFLQYGNYSFGIRCVSFHLQVCRNVYMQSQFGLILHRLHQLSLPLSQNMIRRVRLYVYLASLKRTNYTVQITNIISFYLSNDQLILSKLSFINPSLFKIFKVIVYQYNRIMTKNLRSFIWYTLWPA